MENLIQMSPDMKEIAKAFCSFQAAVSNPKTTEDNPFFNSKYADLANVLRTIKKPLIDNGLSIMQGATVDEIGNTSTGEVKAMVSVETVLLHVSGQFVRFNMRIVADRYAQGKPQPLNAQGVGSAITYGRRYAITALLGIAQEDDDGNAASGNEKGHGGHGHAKTHDSAPAPSQKEQDRTDPVPAMTAQQVLEAMDGFRNDPAATKATVLEYMKKRNALIARMPDDQKKAIRAAYDALVGILESRGKAPAQDVQAPPPEEKAPEKKAPIQPPAFIKTKDGKPATKPGADAWAASLKATNEAINRIAPATTEKTVNEIVKDAEAHNLQPVHLRILQEAAKGRINVIKTMKGGK